MKVQNMLSPNGRPVANQFIITDDKGVQYFQSYETVIAKVDKSITTYGSIILDNNALDYSRTTSKYLYSFLGMDKKAILKAFKEGDILTTDLNK